MREYAQYDAAYVENALETSVQDGLSSATVPMHREKNGKNHLLPERGAPIARFASFLFRKLSFFLMLAALLLSAVVLPLSTTLTVGGVYLAYLIVLFCVFLRCERSNAELAADSLPYVHVVRDGKPCLVSPEELVVGDLMSLSAGDVLFADAYIVSEASVEAVCTRNGERETLIKHGGPCYDHGEAHNTLLTGDALRAGSCYALVTGVSGKAPERGGDLMSFTERSQSRLCRMSVRLSAALAGIMLIFAFFFVRDGYALARVLLCAAVLLAVSPSAWCELWLDSVFLSRNRKMKARQQAVFFSMQDAEDAAKGDCFLLSTRSIFHSSRYVVRAFESGTGIRITEMSKHNTQELSLIASALLKIREKHESAMEEKHLVAFCKRHADEGAALEIGATAFSSEEEGMSIASVRTLADGRAFSFVGADPERLLPYVVSVSEKGRTRLLDKQTKDAMFSAVRKMKKDGHKLIAYAETQTRIFADTFPTLTADMRLLGFLVLSEIPDENISNALSWIVAKQKKAFFFHDGDDPSWISEALPLLRDAPVLDAEDERIVEKLLVFAASSDVPFAIGLHFSPLMQSKLAHILADAGRVTVAAGASFADHRMMCAADVSIAPLKSRTSETAGIVHVSAGMYAREHIASETACVREAEGLLHTFSVSSAYFCASLLIRSVILLLGVLFGAFLLTPILLTLLGFAVDLLAFACLSRVASRSEDATDVIAARDRDLGLFAGSFFGALATGLLGLFMTYFADRFRFDVGAFVLLSILLMLNVGVFRFASARVSPYCVLFSFVSLLFFLGFYIIELFKAQTFFFYGELPFWALVPTVVLFGVGKTVESLILKNKYKRS